MTPRAAVVGYPVSRSLSPRIFRAFAWATGRSISYVAVDLRPAELVPALLAANGGWVGWNVTAPHKVAILAHLDSLEATASEARAVNVVHFVGGRRVGHNTDVEGFLSPLARRGFRLEGTRAVVLGSGGASRAVCAALRRAGAREIRVVGRNVRDVSEVARAFDAETVAWTRVEIVGAIARADVVVNATPVGADGADSPLPAGACFRRGALAYDLAYGFRATPFLRRARDCGAGVVSGLGMLVAQAAATWRIWFGDDLPDDLLECTEVALEKEIR